MGTRPLRDCDVVCRVLRSVLIVVWLCRLWWLCNSVIRVALILRETCTTLRGVLTDLARMAIFIRRPLFPLSVCRQVKVVLVTLLAN